VRIPIARASVYMTARQTLRARRSEDYPNWVSAILHARIRQRLDCNVHSITSPRGFGDANRANTE